MLHVPFNTASGHYCLLEISADDDHYLGQIAGKDRVHMFGADTPENLRQYRIAPGQSYTKTAYAIINSRNEIESVIFGHKTAKKIVTGADLQGNVDSILKEQANIAFEGTPSAIAFYSISAFTRGAGPALINQLLDNCPRELVAATLSPLRSMRKTWQSYADASLSREEKTVLAFLHLMNRDNDVQKFHMGNGAVVRDINIDANTPDSIDGVEGMGVMPNYGYTTDKTVREANKKKLHAINTGVEPEENLVHLMESSMVNRVMSYISAGAMAAAVAPGLTDRLQTAMTLHA